MFAKHRSDKRSVSRIHKKTDNSILKRQTEPNKSIIGKRFGQSLC